MSNYDEKIQKGDIVEIVDMGREDAYYEERYQYMKKKYRVYSKPILIDDYMLFYSVNLIDFEEDKFISFYNVKLKRIEDKVSKEPIYQYDTKHIFMNNIEKINEELACLTKSNGTQNNSISKTEEPLEETNVPF